MKSEESKQATSPDLRELKALVEFLKEHQVAEFDLDRGDLKVRLKFAQPEAAHANASLAELARLLAPSPAAAPAVVAASALTQSPGVQPAVVAKEADSDAGLHIVKSPIVGTFYESPTPGASAYVSAGDKVEKGQVICIVEAMKLMNEIESDATGEVVRRLVSTGQPIEYGQPLFALRLS